PFDDHVMLAAVWRNQPSIRVAVDCPTYLYLCPCAVNILDTEWHNEANTRTTFIFEKGNVEFLPLRIIRHHTPRPFRNFYGRFYSGWGGYAESGADWRPTVSKTRLYQTHYQTTGAHPAL